MNRFDQVSVSAYTPQSMQELAFTPMMKRQKHDEMSKNLVELSAIATDPLNEHRDRALELKNNLESKLGNLSGNLADKGIDSIGISDFYKLQKERNDLIAPTGEIGQINAAKIAEAASYKKFLESDDAKSNSQEINLANWQKHRQKYANAKGRDINGKIINIDDLGAVRYVDEQKMLTDARVDLGMTEESFKKASSMLNDTGNNNGTRFTVNTSKANSTGSNHNQLKSMADYFNKRINDTSDPFRKSLEYTGRDLNKVWGQMSSHMGMMKKYQQSNDSEKSYGNVDYYDPSKDDGNSGKEKTPMFNDAIQDPNSIKNLNKETGEIDFKQIGTLRDERKIIGYDTTTNQPVYGGSTKVQSTYKNTLTPIHQKFYETAAKRLIASGRLSKNADLNSTSNAEKIGFYMKNHMKFPTIASDIIRADVAIDNKLFSGNLTSKDASARNRTLTQDLRQTENGLPLRTMIDVENGGKIKLEEGDKIDYLGVESPINYSSYGFENKFEQSVMGHRAQVLDSKGNVKANVVISRTRNEMDDPTFKKMYEINQSYKAGLNKLGEYIRPSGKYSGNKELSKARIKVNDDNTFQIKMDGYEESPKMDNAQFIQQMQSIMEH